MGKIKHVTIDSRNIPDDIVEIADINGLTASAAELNILDGATLTVAELNILDGVTATTAEINLIDGAVAGTAVASKALALGADKNVDVLAIADGGLKLGAGAGTAVTATAVELNESFVCVDIPDGSAEAVYYAVSPHAGTISKIWTVTNGAVATADITITAAIGATPVTNGVVTIATAASAAGDIDSATPTAANTVTAGQAVNFTVTGGGAGGSPRVHLVMVITR